MIMKKEEMKITELYDLTHTLASDYLKQFTYPWEALAGLSDFIIELGNSLDRQNMRNAVKTSGFIRQRRYSTAPICTDRSSSAKTPRCATVHSSVAAP